MICTLETFGNKNTEQIKQSLVSDNFNLFSKLILLFKTRKYSLIPQPHSSKTHRHCIKLSSIKTSSISEKNENVTLVVCDSFISRHCHLVAVIIVSNIWPVQMQLLGGVPTHQNILTKLLMVYLSAMIIYSTQETYTFFAH